MASISGLLGEAEGELDSLLLQYVCDSSLTLHLPSRGIEAKGFEVGGLYYDGETQAAGYRDGELLA